tara:strand:- start:497 stop:733 length:237 start_codon:yes stop_codon:yes gene_type:complete
MKYFLTLLFVLSFLSAEQTEIGRYQLETTVYTSKKGKTYIVETILDTQTGKVVVRRKKSASSYKLPYKNRKGKVITEE